MIPRSSPYGSLKLMILLSPKYVSVHIPLSRRSRKAPSCPMTVAASTASCPQSAAARSGPSPRNSSIIRVCPKQAAITNVRAPAFPWSVSYRGWQGPGFHERRQSLRLPFGLFSPQPRAHLMEKSSARSALHASSILTISDWPCSAA